MTTIDEVHPVARSSRGVHPCHSPTGPYECISPAPQNAHMTINSQCDVATRNANTPVHPQLDQSIPMSENGGGIDAQRRFGTCTQLRAAQTPSVRPQEHTTLKKMSTCTSTQNLGPHAGKGYVTPLLTDSATERYSNSVRQYEDCHEGVSPVNPLHNCSKCATHGVEVITDHPSANYSHRHICAGGKPNCMPWSVAARYVVSKKSRPKSCATPGSLASAMSVTRQIRIMMDSWARDVPRQRLHARLQVNARTSFHKRLQRICSKMWELASQSRSSRCEPGASKSTHVRKLDS